MITFLLIFWFSGATAVVMLTFIKGVKFMKELKAHCPEAGWRDVTEELGWPVVIVTFIRLLMVSMIPIVNWMVAWFLAFHFDEVLDATSSKIREELERNFEDMLYKLTMERTLRIGVEFECDSEEQALHEAGARFVHAMQNPKEFLGGDVEGDYALCDEEGKDLVVWS